MRCAQKPEKTGFGSNVATVLPLSAHLGDRRWPYLIRNKLDIFVFAGGHLQKKKCPLLNPGDEFSIPAFF